jgi:repressor LexA
VPGTRFAVSPFRIGPLDYHSGEWYLNAVDGLTAIQRQVLAAIRRRVDRGDPAPTYRDLCAEFGWASTGTVRDHLQALARKGVLHLSGRRARLVRLQEQVEPVGRVPLVGRIVAGSPVPATEEVEGHLPVPHEWIRQGSHFALRVAGDSMQGAGILDGDIVIVRREASAGDGDVVAATVDGDTTLKTLRRRKGRSLLCPENPAFAPIDITETDAVLHGVVVGVMRRLTASRPASEFLRVVSGHTAGSRGSANLEGGETG